MVDKTNATELAKKARKNRAEREVEGGVAGGLAGAALGAVAGPVGAVAGAVVGAAIGVAAGLAVEKGAERRLADDRELDEQIGVTEGELGAPNLEHPPAKVGAYSSASAGVTTEVAEDEPAEGPIPAPKG